MCRRCQIERPIVWFRLNHTCAGRGRTCKKCRKLGKLRSPEALAKKRAWYYARRQNPEEIERQRVANMAGYWKAVDKRRATARRISKSLREQCIQAYGAICACCGEEEAAFLCLDHKHNDGAAHRKQRGGTLGVYRDVIRRGFPPEFQVLCWNCNEAKAHYGECPHETRRNAEIDWAQVS